jgi:hypothetical protein
MPRTPQQLTLRGLPPRLERSLRELARREGLSLNKAAVRLLEKGAGFGERHDDRIGHSFDHLIGTWSKEEGEAFLESIQSCERVDSELWD